MHLYNEASFNCACARSVCDMDFESIYLSSNIPSPLRFSSIFQHINNRLICLFPCQHVYQTNKQTNKPMLVCHSRRKSHERSSNVLDRSFRSQENPIKTCHALTLKSSTNIAMCLFETISCQIHLRDGRSN